MKNTLTLAAASLLFSISVNEEAPKAATSERLKMTESQEKPIVVAVIDTGVDLTHPMIKDYIWMNENEIKSNGVDDDFNGFTDDLYGWSFVGKKGELFDHHGHGTHIAGIIVQNLSATANAKLMILKYYDTEASESETLKASNAAFEYAIQMGAQIINYSGGGDLASAEERRLLKLASEKNIFVVAASGNDGREIDAQGFFPASYGFDHIISVGSTSEDGLLLKSSNRGVYTVDIAAFGENVSSSLPHSRKGLLTGTSQATAMVTGILASLMSEFPNMSSLEYKDRLIKTAQSQTSLEGLIKNPKIPALDRAIQMRDRSDFNNRMKVTHSKIAEVFDDPVSGNFIDRTVSSENRSMEVNGLRSFSQD